MEARNAIYSNIVDAIISLINAVNDLNIKSTQNEDRKKIEESKSVIFKYTETLQREVNQNTRRNCYSMDEISKKGGSSQQRQMSTDVLGSGTSSQVKDTNTCPSKEFIIALQYLWSTPSIQEAYERRNEFQLIDSASYFLDDLDRVCLHGYEPTDDDILRTRVRTTGIVKIEFEFRHLTVSISKEILLSTI